MSVATTYPGVYIQEAPSGVRTIAGVSTSIALFIGRTKQGPLNTPKRCLNFGDFEKTFSSVYANSDLARAVRLFYTNGGNDCYVMRIANDATKSEVTLKNELATEVLQVMAKSHGQTGDNIRLSVTYNTQQPESTFNIEVFTWVKNPKGQMVKSDTEVWQGLTMEPNTARYAVDYINQNSSLIELAATANVAPAVNGYSQSGRPIPNRTNTIFRDKWVELLDTTNPETATTKFRINVDAAGYVDVDLATIDFNSEPLNVVGNIQNDLAAAIKTIIDSAIPSGSQVDVSFVAGPSGPMGEDNQDTLLLRIASANGDVLIQPALNNDFAGSLMLGGGQGGIEISRFSHARPAPTGMVFNLADLVNFAEQEQTAFNTITIGNTTIPLGNSLQTDTATGSRMYQDGLASSVTENSDGVREKWAIIHQAIANKSAEDPGFKWAAEVWGSRLALIALDGGDNSQGSITTSGGDNVNISDNFTTNVRYYSLGTTGQGNFQTPAVAPASDGNAPKLSDYRNAFKVIDKQVDLFNLMILSQDADHNAATTASLWGPASVFCQQRRAFLLMDGPASWKSVQEATDPAKGVNSLRLGLVKDYSAIFYPRVSVRENGLNVNVGASGAVAGVMARIDSTRGVWKAPAGVEADVRGVVGLEQRLSDAENGVVNPRAINTLRVFPNGIVSWGARTMEGDDDFGSEYKYIPVRRLALYVEESLYRGLTWAVFEPNDEPLWAQIRLNVGAFMHNLFRQGAFQGQTPSNAYFVKCDAETTTQNDRNLGMVNIWVGFAPLKPAEFVILYLQQMAGQVET